MMKKDHLIKFINYIKQLGYLSLSLSVLFLAFYLIRGTNIFTNYGRLLIVLGIQLFIILFSNYLLKKLNKE